MNYSYPDFAQLWPFTWLLIFLVMIILDYIWAKYNQATVEKRPLRAGFLAVAIYALGAFGVLGYSHDYWLLIPACAGAFVGTYLATRERIENVG